MCDIIVESPDPHTACRRVLDASLYEWEERMSSDNITVLVIQLEWDHTDGCSPPEAASLASMTASQQSAGRSSSLESASVVTNDSAVPSTTGEGAVAASAPAPAAPAVNGNGTRTAAAAGDSSWSPGPSGGGVGPAVGLNRHGVHAGGEAAVV